MTADARQERNMLTINVPSPATITRENFCLHWLSKPQSIGRTMIRSSRLLMVVCLALAPRLVHGQETREDPPVAAAKGDSVAGDVQQAAPPSTDATVVSAGQFTIVGKLLNRHNRPAKNVDVDVAEVTETGDLFLHVDKHGKLVMGGSATTNAKGAFTIQANRDFFKKKPIRLGLVTETTNLVKNQFGANMVFAITATTKKLDINLGSKLRAYVVEDE